jgi:hypothetical protein
VIIGDVYAIKPSAASFNIVVILFSPHKNNLYLIFIGVSIVVIKIFKSQLPVINGLDVISVT